MFPFILIFLLKESKFWFSSSPIAIWLQSKTSNITQIVPTKISLTKTFCSIKKYEQKSRYFGMWNIMDKENQQIKIMININNWPHWQYHSQLEQWTQHTMYYVGSLIPPSVSEEGFDRDRVKNKNKNKLKVGDHNNGPNNTVQNGWVRWTFRPTHMDPFGILSQSITIPFICRTKSICE